MTTYLLYIIIALQVADIVTTYLAITNGKGIESNGILAPLFKASGLIPGLLIVKGGFVALLWWAAPLVPVDLLYALAAFYAWVIFNNVQVLSK